MQVRSEHSVAVRATGHEARLACRNGQVTGHTAGLAPGYVQGNLCILPAELAIDFAAFCQRNPKPCPLIGMSAVGDPAIPDLGDIDIRTDLARYRVFRDGVCVDEPTEIGGYWRDDLVAFVLGCSFSFEAPLIEAGIPMHHIELDTVVPMYRTSVQCTPAGPFRGRMVVSMRLLSPADAIRAIQITSRYPAVHGAPVHIGEPQALGIADLMKPDYGDPPPVPLEGMLPVFWACGVTPQSVVLEARPPLCITHKPGSMLVTDRLNKDLAAF
ncbi:MAG: putative hydro-lyase [Burkholderiaceae bacterium]